MFNCDEVMQLHRTATLDRPPVYATGDAKLFDTAFSPSRIDFAIAAGPMPSHVSMNTNFARGWTSTAGPVTMDGDGRPSVTLTATGRFMFSFVPPGLVTGFGLLVAALVGTTLAWRRDPRATADSGRVHHAAQVESV